MKLNKILSAAAIACGLFGSLTAQAATILTLDPSNTNAPAGPVISAADGQFQTDNIHGQLTSRLQVSATSGLAAWNETGTILIDDFQLGGVTQSSGVYRGGGGNYDLYATFIGSGFGAWVSPTTYISSSVTSLDIYLWASPSTGTAPTIGTPTSSNTLGSGVTAGSQDFLLATSTIILDGSEFASANTSGVTFLAANLTFAPEPGTEGGFFVSPNPFRITLGSSSSTNTNETTYANGVWTTGSSLKGTSNLTPLAVPEPSALSLVGVSLLGAGLAARRRRREPAIA